MSRVRVSVDGRGVLPTVEVVGPVHEGLRMLQIEVFCIGPLQSNCYLIWEGDSGQGVIIDPGIESETALFEAQKRDVRVTGILLTHGHFDHTYGASFFKNALSCPLMIHREDAPLLAEAGEHAALFGFAPAPSPPPDAFLTDGERVPVGSGALEVLHTPGHTPGSICLRADGFVLSGDTLFAQSVGRTDLPGGSYEKLMESIREKLMPLPDPTDVLPGHGPSTRIGFEKKNNPFLRGPLP
jgi:hydroxyacylglutathione hydrolase